MKHKFIAFIFLFHVNLTDWCNINHYSSNFGIADEVTRYMVKILTTRNSQGLDPSAKLLPAMSILNWRLFMFFVIKQSPWRRNKIGAY